MRIQKPAFINIVELGKHRVIFCFDELRAWLDNDSEDHWVCGDTSGILELQNAHIESLLVTKMFLREDAGFGFQGKELLVVCNRSNPALEEYMYVGYDRWFCNIARWVFALHTSDRYSLLLEKYKDARKRYEDAKSASSIILIGDTVVDLLAFYSQYNATSPLPLLYDCLDTHIALFSAGQKNENELRAVLEDCEKHWLARVQGDPVEDSDLVRCALARGYFALGIEYDDDWARGKQLLSEHRGLQREND